DHAAAPERPAVVDTHHHRFAIPAIGHADHSSERQRTMRGCQFTRMNALPARGAAARISVALRSIDRSEASAMTCVVFSGLRRMTRMLCLMFCLCDACERENQKSRKPKFPHDHTRCPFFCCRSEEHTS